MWGVSRKPGRGVHEVCEVIESEVENESSVGDTDVSIPSMRWWWKLGGWLRTQECRNRQAEPGVWGGGVHFRLAGDKTGSHTITSRQERT